ncbi:hypothetical protein [Paenibacillus cymbidii]|uniref:hypothetical protein n=1 Tax=Paenibacillus cymbidii TaxID=1639034 RepID=UPI00107FFCC0|nr:hypothetical protein [Paenibacillus cymbidii]
MNKYLEETKFATSNLIDLVTTEMSSLNELSNRINTLANENNEVHAKLMSNELIDEGMESNHIHVAAMIRHVKFQLEKIDPLFKDKHLLELSIESKKESLNALAGAILQIAKQGISIAYGKLNSCPNGRSIKGEFLKNIIWQARNQSLHYEEGKFNKDVQECFKSLGITLSNKNLAMDIIYLLEWDNYETYKSDMQSLLE